MKILKPSNDWSVLSKAAWAVRDNAHLYGKTKVGVALISVNNNIFKGCNVEHQFRSHDIHAEVNAISSMIANGDKIIEKLLVVADREMFTPCGSCMDWILQFATKDTVVGFQSTPDGDIQTHVAYDLMPFYPK